MVDEVALVGVEQPSDEIGYGEPVHRPDLVVVGGQAAAAQVEDEMVHGLVHAATSVHEPEVDLTERAAHGGDDAGLFGHLAHRGLFCRLAGLDVPFRQAPLQTATMAAPPDEQSVTDGVEDEAAR